VAVDMILSMHALFRYGIQEIGNTSVLCVLMLFKNCIVDGNI